MEQRIEAIERQPDFRVVPGPFYTAAQLSIAPRYRHIEDAIAAMGEGIVLADRGGRLVAFHEKHLAIVERRFA